jgi:MurNAc alpha-1-phosphate uridylyltransferase
MQGLHLTADLEDCQCAPHWLTHAPQLLQAVEDAVHAVGLTTVGRLAHTFAGTPRGPGGVTATVLLAESHVCVHTWPETRGATLDVYVCNFSGDHSAQARELLARLLALLRPMRAQEHALQRGTPAPQRTPALVLAAGRGERMRPLTDTCPKPLLSVQGQPLLLWHVQALLRGGFDRLVVNTAWLTPQISSFFNRLRTADGHCLLPIKEQTRAFDLQISDEQADFGGALETAGGICRALPLLGARMPAHPQDVFWVVAGDVFVPGFAFTQASVERFRSSTALAHLWLVPNPSHNLRGDFGLDPDGLALNLPATDTRTPRYTYSTIGLYRAELFAPPWCDLPHGNPEGIQAALAPLLRRAMDAGRITAELYTGPWTDVGTPQRLAQLNRTGAEFGA